MMNVRKIMFVSAEHAETTSAIKYTDNHSLTILKATEPSKSASLITERRARLISMWAKGGPV
jgi:hypothetical protein